MKKLSIATLILLSFFTTSITSAWDGVGHRLTAAIALNFLSDQTTTELIDLLQRHPRFEEDFTDAMPAAISQASDDQKNLWLLGQAAYWPDIARGLPDEERERFNRPWWHYTDGAWVRGSAQFQGNSYVGIEPFENIAGEDPLSIREDQSVSNVVTGIDYNTWVLSNSSIPAAQRAVALCWVLHLIGDIHQPLHTGSMFSDHTFERGDLGGNRIPIGNRNLHSIWDSALSEEGVAANIPLILQQVSGFNSPKIQGVESDWDQWMSESRQYLQTSVYTNAIVEATEAADSNNASDIQATELSASYIEHMKRISRQRIGLAGLRLAIWFENNLP